MAVKPSQPERVGVLLVNTGSPDSPTPRSVKRYLKKFLMDKRIAPMNRLAWWFILTLFILPKRAKASAEKYRSIWSEGVPPLVRVQRKLAGGLESYYANRGASVSVESAMTYSSPSIDQALRKLRDKGCSSLVVLPLYPQSAHSTTKAVEDQFARVLRKSRWDVPCEFIDCYYENYTYIRAIAGSIENAGFRVESNDRLLFSYHSIPLKDIDEGDEYELQASASSLMIASELGLDRKRWTIAYQCRFDKNREWLKPFTKDALRRLGQAGEGRVFLVCPNFAIDCLETLYDVPRELRPEFFQAARCARIQRSNEDFVYVPCLNASRAHLRVLIDVLNPYINCLDESE